MLTIPRSIVKSSTKDFKVGNIYSYDSVHCSVCKGSSRPLKSTRQDLLPPKRERSFYDSGQTTGTRQRLSLLSRPYCQRLPSVFRVGAGLEAFSHDRADDSFASLPVRVNAKAKYPNKRFLSY